MPTENPTSDRKLTANPTSWICKGSGNMQTANCTGTQTQKSARRTGREISRSPDEGLSARYGMSMREYRATP